MSWTYIEHKNARLAQFEMRESAYWYFSSFHANTIRRGSEVTLNIRTVNLSTCGFNVCFKSAVAYSFIAQNFFLSSVKRIEIYENSLKIQNVHKFVATISWFIKFFTCIENIAGISNITSTTHFMFHFIHKLNNLSIHSACPYNTNQFKPLNFRLRVETVSLIYCTRWFIIVKWMI